MEVFLTIISGAVINRIRGGLLGASLPKGRGDDLAAALFGALVGAATAEWWVILAFAAAFRIGEAHGWGHWMGVAVQSAGAARTDESPIDDLLDHEPDLDRWAFYGLTLRGLLWGTCLAVPAGFISLWASLAFIAAGATMGLLYFATRYVPTDPSTRWALGEYFMGAVFGAALVFMVSV